MLLLLKLNLRQYPPDDDEDENEEDDEEYVFEV